MYRLNPLLTGFVLLVAACGGNDGSSPTQAPSTSSPAPASTAATAAAPPTTTTTAVPTTAAPITTSSSSGATPAPAADAAECLTPTAAIPQTGVALPVPEGFYVADAFTGLFNDASGASVVVVELPERVSVDGSFTEFLDRLRDEQRTNILERYGAELAGSPAVLVRASQTAQGIRFERWIAITESDAGTLLLTAQAPASEPATGLDTLRNVILCAVWTPGEVHAFPDNPPFSIQAVPPFGEEQSFVGGIIFDAGDGALFVAAPSIAPAPGDRAQVAGDLLFSLELDREPTITAGPEPVSIDGFEGIRLDGEGAIDGEAFVLFQVVLFGENDSYWRMVALMPAGRAAELLPAAEAMAESFHRN
jgi:hypothetical protein